APIVLGVTAMAAAVGIMVMALRTTPGRGEAGNAAAISTGAPIPPPGPASGTAVEMHLKATPPEATIFIDDIPAGTNPFSAEFANDGVAHRIRVEAPGYKPYGRMVVFDGSELSVNLEALAPTTPASAPSASPGAKPAGGVHGRPGAKVDSTDPWKR